MRYSISFSLIFHAIFFIEMQLNLKMYISESKFQVHVTLPAYTLDTDKYIAANISARSAVERIARGNATINVYGRYLNGNESMRMIWEEKVSMVSLRH